VRHLGLSQHSQLLQIHFCSPSAGTVERRARTRLSSSFATAWSASLVACWQISAACTLSCPVRAIRSRVLTPAAAASVLPVCLIVEVQTRSADGSHGGHPPHQRVEVATADRRSLRTREHQCVRCRGRSLAMPRQLLGDRARNAHRTRITPRRASTSEQARALTLSCV